MQDVQIWLIHVGGVSNVMIIQHRWSCTQKSSSSFCSSCCCGSVNVNSATNGKQTWRKNNFLFHTADVQKIKREVSVHFSLLVFLLCCFSRIVDRLSAVALVEAGGGGLTNGPTLHEKKKKKKKKNQKNGQGALLIYFVANCHFTETFGHCRQATKIYIFFFPVNTSNEVTVKTPLEGYLSICSCDTSSIHKAKAGSALYAHGTLQAGTL